MAESRLVPDAIDDVKEIAAYIAIKDAKPETANRMVDATLDKCDLLAGQPHMGEARPELGEGCRISPIKRWAIVFRPTEYGVEVLRGLDGARDYDKLFGE